MKTVVISILALAISSSCLIAEEAPKAETTILETLLSATSENDLEKFESVCDETMKEAMTEETLPKVSTQLSTLLKQGYQKVYMGVLNRGTTKTYYWKLDFEKANAPDILIELSMENEKATGFYVR